MGDDDTPFLITPPPGLLPESEPSVDSGTRRSTPIERIAAPLPPFFPGGAPASPPPIVPAPAPPPAPTAPTPPPATSTPPPAPETAPVAVAPATWTLRLPDGRELAVEGAIVLGRSPSAPPDFADALPLALVDPARSVSKTHAVLERDGDDLLVHDLASTNGVLVVDPDGSSRAVAPGEPERVPSGGAIELGQYVLRAARS